MYYSRQQVAIGFVWFFHGALPEVTAGRTRQDRPVDSRSPDDYDLWPVLLFAYSYRFAEFSPVK